jgi:O-antigen ligase
MIYSNFKNKTIFFCSFLFCLLPIALITGPFLSELIIINIILFFLFFSIKEKQWKYYKNIFFYFLIIWSSYLILLSFFSKNIELSLQSSLFYFRFGLFSISLWFLINNNPKIYKYFFYSLLFCFIILIFDGFYQYFTNFNIFGFPKIGSRVSSFFREELIMGSYVSRLMPIFFGLLLLLHKVDLKIIIFSSSVFISTDILIFLSGERSAFFYLILFVVLLIILTSVNYSRILAFGVSIFLIFLISINSDTIRERMLEKTIKQTSILEDTPNIFSIQHQVIYISALRIFKDNIMFGIGPKLFREECKIGKYQVFTDLDASINGCQTHPHNSYIQLLTETGVIGFAPIIFIFIYLNYLFAKHFYLYRFKKIKLYDDSTICFLIAIYISLWPLIPTGNFFNNWLSIIYYLPMGFLLNKIYK